MALWENLGEHGFVCWYDEDGLGGVLLRVSEDSFGGV